MIIPPLSELSAFLGREPRKTHTVDPVRGAQEHIEFPLSVAGSNVKWRISPALGHCQFLGQDGARSSIEAFIKCDAIVINTDIEEEGGQCIVIKADGWHVCITPGQPDRLFFSIYGHEFRASNTTKERPNKCATDNDGAVPRRV
jgi:hypothetical protein